MYKIRPNHAGKQVGDSQINHSCSKNSHNTHQAVLPYGRVVVDVVDDDVDDGASWCDATINLCVLRQLSLNEGNRDVAAQSLFDAHGQVGHL